MTIIRTKEWGERKKALQQLDGGKAWRILVDEFFPKLRCVRFAIFCKWDSTKPYMSKPVEVSEPKVSSVDTVYVRDTVYMMKEVVHMPSDNQKMTYVTEEEEPDRPKAESNITKTEVVRERTPKVWDTPWYMGIKTNLLADAIVVPQFGLEIQLAPKLSLDIQGWATNYNILTPHDKNASVYGFAPELRLWENSAMRTGSFFGIHGNCAWYTLQWKDLLYQNGPKDMWEGNYHNSGNSDPAWSVGLTYGYVIGLGAKKNWALELMAGLGYAKYTQNTASLSGDTWMLVEHQTLHHFGVTRLGINLTYRFNVRRIKTE
jgi:hypothetical protein